MATSAEEMLEAALDYADMGYPVFPCRVGGKEPACIHGCKDATTSSEQIEEWWADTPYNIGISTQGLLVVDVDGEGNPWLGEIGEKLDDLMGCPQSITPRKGFHFFFQQPHGTRLKNTTDKLARAVDTRADGGYVVAPPSNLEGGGGYRWMPERELERFLGEPPEWIIDQLNTPQGSTSSPRSDRPAIDVEPIGEGSRNATLTSRAGKMRRIGMSFQEIEGALQATNCSQCNPPLEPIEVRKIAESVSKYPSNEPLDDLPVEPQKQLEPFPQELLYPPGLIEQVMDYNLSGAFREQPILALAGALALMSSITGRKVMDATGTRTNLMILGVAASGSGKERARQVNKDILFHAGGATLVGPESPASATGIVSAINANPSLLFQWDEMGRLLKSISGPGASSHLANITTVMMKLFTASGSVYLGDAYADTTRNTSINQPHSVLYGTTVPSNLYESLSADSVLDGFLSRMLIFESEDNAPPYHQPEVGLPPEGILEQVRYWIEKKGTGNLNDQNPTPEIIPTSDKALSVFREFQDYGLTQERDKDNKYGNLWSRSGEKAKKLALLHTCSRRANKIDVAAAVWACKLSGYLTEKLAAIGREWVSETLHEKNLQKVYRWLVARGGRATKRELSRAMQHLKKHDREMIIEDLQELLGATIETVQGRGRPSEIVILPHHVVKKSEVTKS